MPSAGPTPICAIVAKAPCGWIAAALAFVPAPGAATVPLPACPPPSPVAAVQTASNVRTAVIDNCLTVRGEQMPARLLDTRLSVGVEVNGNGPFRFLVDSGADRSVIGVALAKKLNLPVSVTVRLNDIAELAYESVNVPEVMTPWEMREHLMFLLGEVQPHPQLGAAQQAVARFLPAWFALWAQYGTDQAGWPRYRALLDGLDELLGRVAAPLQLKNGAQFVACARAMIMDVALADRSKNLGAYEPRAPASASPAKATASRPGRDPDFDRPVFVVSSPRSGSTLLFETLAQAPGLTTIGRESHALIEGMPALNAGMRGFESNRLTAVDATPAECRRRARGVLDGVVAPGVVQVTCRDTDGAVRARARVVLAGWIPGIPSWTTVLEREVAKERIP